MQYYNYKKQKKSLANRAKLLGYQAISRRFKNPYMTPFIFYYHA